MSIGNYDILGEIMIFWEMPEKYDIFSVDLMSGLDKIDLDCIVQKYDIFVNRINLACIVWKYNILVEPFLNTHLWSFMSSWKVFLTTETREGGGMVMTRFQTLDLL